MHGRDHERGVLTGLLDAAAAGSASTLVLRGEAGAGKSALLDTVAAEALARGFRVLRVQGLESEAPLAYASLHQLLRPVRALLDALPAPQAKAVRAVLGEEEGTAVDPFLIGLATLTLLTEAAETGPLLCVVDDAHWLDDASAEALLLASRRLAADPVAVVLSVRDGDPRDLGADGLPSLRLGGLDEVSARALLAETLAVPPAEEVVRALLEQSRGNPLALVELPSELTAAQLAGAAPVPTQLHLSDRVQRVFLDRCRRLAPEVQTFLLVAAADDTGSLAVVQRAAGLLDVTPAALQEAEAAGLLVTDRDAIRVRHPLVRSAVYQAATGHERRTAHQALATALEGTQHPDRQAWHLAAATEGPDVGVASALERTAVRAERSGGYAAAAAAYERAAELTASEEDRAGRWYAAGRAAWASGQPERARRLAETAKALADERVLRADIDRLRARVEVNVGSPVTAHRILLTAARAVAGDDPVRALEMRVAATLSRLYNADIPDEVDDAGAPVPAPDARTTCLQHLLAAATCAARQEWGPGLEEQRRAIAVADQVDDPDVLANLGNAALHLGDDASHRACFTRVLAGARERGAGMTVLYALPRLAFADLLGGQWSRARDAADEALALSADTGQHPLGAAPLAWRTLLAALQGDPGYDDLLPRLDEARGQHLGVLTDPVHDMSRWAAGVRAAHAGDPAEALHQLSRLRLAPLQRMAAADRVEAAVRAGDLSLAATWVEELAAFAEATGWGWALGVTAYGRALLAEPAAAGPLFEAALAHYADAARPYDLARAQLAYGELLRRSGRRVDARSRLRAALTTFEELGAEPLVSRAGQELRASGETARKRNASTLLALTPMELQVVQHVSRGLSNKDVAAQLWISPRTVAFHLRGAFAKLGVSSRGELALLPQLEGAVGRSASG